MNNNVIGQSEALLRYYFKVDPNFLNDDEYAFQLAQLDWILEQKREANGK